MKKSEKTRKAILESATALLLQNGGNAETVTIREIAGRARLSVGLVNHYFSTKQHLIEECVQRIIGGVIDAFRPETADEAPCVVRVGDTAVRVMDFLMENQSISRVSILSDMREPDARDNTARSFRGFASVAGLGAPDARRLVQAYCLCAVMQSAFLRKDTLKATPGVDFNDKNERDAFLRQVVASLFAGEE